MAGYTGKLLERQPTEIADIAITEGTNYLWLSIVYQGNEVIKAPLSKTLDTNGIEAAIINIVNQCAIVEDYVSVDLTEVP